MKRRRLIATAVVAFATLHINVGACDAVTEAEALLLRAAKSAQADRYEEAVRDYRAAVRLSRASQADPSPLARALCGLGQTLLRMGKYRDALPPLQEARNLAQEQPDADRQVHLSALSGLGTTLSALGRLPDALPVQRQAVAVAREIYRGDHEDVAATLGALAQTLRFTGANREALRLDTEAVAMYRRMPAANREKFALARNSLGTTLGNLGKHDEALRQYREALEVCRRHFEGDQPTLALSLGNVAFALNKVGRHNEALVHAQEAMTMKHRLYPESHPESITALRAVAGPLRALDRYEDAVELEQDALKRVRGLLQGDHPAVATGLSNLATTLAGAGRHRDALAYQKEALAMYRRLFRRDHPSLATVLSSAGAEQAAMGRAHEARTLYESSLAMNRRLFAGDHPGTATTLSSLATLHTDAGRLHDALRCWRESLAMRQRMYGDDHVETARSLRGLATTLWDLGHPADATKHLEAALAMSRRLFGEDHTEVARCLHSLALHRWRQHHDERAVELLRKAIATLRRVYPDGHAQVAQALQNLARVESELHHHEPADRLASEAISMTRRLLGAAHPAVAGATATLATCYRNANRLEEARTLARQAVALEDRLGEGGQRSPRLLLAGMLATAGDARGAEQTLRPLIDTLEVHRRQAASLGMEGRARYLAARGWTAPYALMMDVLLAQDKPAEALEIVERARGREFLDLIEQGRRDPLALARQQAKGDEARQARIQAVDDAVQDAWSRVAIAKRALSRAHHAGDTAAMAKATEAVREANTSLTNALRERLFAVRESLPEGRPLSSAGIQALLAPGELGLVYALGDASTVFLVSRDQISAHPLRDDQAPVRAQALAEGVAAFLARLAEPGHTAAPGLDHPGAVLFRRLVPKAVWQAVRRAKRLVVFPHGPLHRLPMEALVVSHAPTGNASPSRKPQFWLQAGPPIAYAASASVLAALRSRRPASGTRVSLVALGDPAFGAPTTTPGGSESKGGLFRGAGDRALVPLPWTRREVERVAASVTAAHPDARTSLLLGKQATEAALFDAAPTATILHIATHGVVDPRLGMRSAALALTPSPRAPGDDGALSLGDLLEGWRGHLKNTPLVVLSACETQLGTVHPNEGMVSLPWGFCFAGARCCIASLWRVDDEATARLMQELYRRMLTEGQPPCEALHAARQALEKEYPDPHHWAAFLFTGAP